MACCCDDIRSARIEQRYPDAFEVLDYLPIAQTELNLIDTNYGADGSAMQVTASDQDRCNAYSWFVRAMSLYAARHNEASTYGYLGGALALAAGSAFVLFGIATGGLGFALGLALGATAATYAGLNSAQYIAYLRDAKNDTDIVCQLLDAMPLQNPTAAQLVAAVNALTTANNGEGAIKFALQTWALRNNYGHAILLHSLAQSVDGQMPSWDCSNCSETCVPFSMTHDVSGGNITFPSPLVVSGGAYNATYDDYSVIGGGNGSITLRWEFGTCRDINHIRIDRWFNATQLCDTRFSYNDGIYIASNNGNPSTEPTPFEYNGAITGVNNLTIELLGTAGTYYIGWRYVEVS